MVAAGVRAFLIMCENVKPTNGGLMCESPLLTVSTSSVMIVIGIIILYIIWKRNQNK